MRLIRIEDRETDFGVRGFAPCPQRVRQILELHGKSFARGFNAAVATSSPDELSGDLERVPAPERGFAYEGAAMGLSLLDLLLPGPRRRVAAFAVGPGSPHVYMVHVGAGWALARLRRRPWGRLPLDPLLRWLALDGYGFHDAFFHPERVVRGRRVPRRLTSDGRPVFDQGVGRALWFVEAADPDRIAVTVGSFERERRGDLWSGVGLAAAYAGAVTAADLETLRARAGRFRPHVAQGVAFATKARLRAGNLVPHTERACEILCGVGATQAAEVTDRALGGIRPDGSAAAYEGWRAEIRARFGGR